VGKDKGEKLHFIGAFGSAAQGIGNKKHAEFRQFFHSKSLFATPCFSCIFALPCYASGPYRCFNSVITPPGNAVLPIVW
jgi:hypothetical protein